MKKSNWKYLPLLVTCLLLPLIANAGDGQGIKNSAHDFSARSWNNEFGQEYAGEICHICHVPHDHGREMFKGYDGDGLLWNHSISTATYAMYTSETLAGTIAEQPTGKAKLCLGCHDGTVAIDAFNGSSGGEAWIPREFEISRLREGSSINLMGSHPISVEYVGNPKVALAGGLHDPTDQTWFDGGAVMRTLEGGLVQCSTCHDVHNRVSVPTTPLLRAGQRADHAGSVTASTLCLTCHNK